MTIRDNRNIKKTTNINSSTEDNLILNHFTFVLTDYVMAHVTKQSHRDIPNSHKINGRGGELF